VLHAQVLDHPVHASFPIHVLVSVRVFAVQPIHNVSLEMLEEVDFGFERGWVCGDGMGGALGSWGTQGGRASGIGGGGNIVKVTVKLLASK
jgi:hypothetical protein